MKRSRVLITGGAGFIGSHLADALAEKGYKIRVLDNLEPAVHNGRWPGYVSGKGYELIKGDVRRKGDWRRALKGVDCVFHFAAYQDQRPDFGKFFQTNTVGAALLYELITGDKLPIKKIVLASTQFVYGDGRYRCLHGSRGFFYPELRSIEQFKREKWGIVCPHGKPAVPLPFKEDGAPNPTNAYGLSKLAAENLALRFGKTHKIPTVILRYSIVQGPRQSPRNLYSGALRIFVAQALAAKPITVYEDGEQKRDFVNVDDAVRAAFLVFRNPKTDFQIYNVGGGKGYKLSDFAGLVKEITGSPSSVVFGGFRSTDTRHAVSDIGKLEKLGWKPKLTPRDSIKAYVEWIKKEFRRR